MEKKMKNLRSLPVLSLTFAGLLLAGTAAKADTTLTLLPPNQSSLSGAVVSFDATVTNTGGSAVYLNSDSYNVDSPLTVDDSPYVLFPLSLNPGDSYTGVLFNVDIPLGTSSGLYNGYFSILGGSDGNAQLTLATADFNIDVTPEPSSLLLLLSGMAALAGALRRRLVR